MNLIAVSGSSKTEWAFVENNILIALTETEGINPYFQTRREMSRSIRLGLGEEYFHKKLNHIYFYGAGCSDEIKKKMVSQSLVSQFKTPASIESDLLGTARSQCMDKVGIACILGTGSNSCFYDGTQITKNVRPGGYILGDEGSASAIGRAFLSDVLKELAPQDLAETFFFQQHTSVTEIMEAVYDKPLPHYYLSSVSSFLSEYQQSAYVKNLVVNSFRNFMKRNLCQYQYQNVPVYFTGFVALNFSLILRDVCKEFNFEPANIGASVMQGLVKYHAQHLCV